MDKKSDNPLIIVLQHQGRRLSERKKSLVNSHVAKRVHRRRQIQAPKHAAKKGSYTVQKFRVGQAPVKQSQTSSTRDDLLTPSPRTLLAKGNADPFATTVVVVDPVVNHLITFYREYHLPLQHWRRVDASRTSSYATTFFQHIVNALQDSCTGYAYLSGYASLIANRTHDTAMATVALDFRARAYMHLHERLAQGWAHAQTSLAWTLYSFFTSSINGHDFAAAEIHGRALRDILQAMPSWDDERLLNSLLWQDLQRAALTLTRPLFDLRRMTKSLVAGPFFSLVWRNMRHARLKDTTALDAKVANIFSETSYLLFMTDGHTHGQFRLTKPAIRQTAARSLVLEGQLLNHYVDKTADIAATPDSEKSNHRDICVLLAGLYWLRRAGHHEGFRVKSKSPEPYGNIYDSGTQIRERIRRAMMDARPMEMSSDPTLLLWILYVGSVIEQNLDSPDMWFNRVFAAQALRMDLADWTGVETVLAEVLYRPELSPDAPRYFDRFARLSSPGTIESLAVTPGDHRDVAEPQGASVCQSPGGSSYSYTSRDVPEEDRITTELHDSIYGLFD
jgi:hypothetical protein